MKSRGISLVELLLTVALLGVTMAAVSGAFVSGLQSEARIKTAKEDREEAIGFEDRLKTLIEGADLSDPASVFESPIPNSSSEAPSTDSSALGAGSSSLVFATWNRVPNVRYLEQTGLSWANLNAQYGPQGGTSTIALSTIPVGDAGNKQGLFLREQRPPQSDPSVGGTERLYSAKVRDIRFEFYDGTTWQTAWDSKNGQKGKLPNAVRVTYLLVTEKTPHIFIARLANAAGSPPSS